jgi:hypothetical protein
VEDVSFVDREFIKNLPDDPPEAVLIVCERFFRRCGPDVSMENGKREELAHDAYWFVSEMLGTVWGNQYGRPTLDPDEPQNNYKAITNMFGQWRTQASMQIKANRRAEMERAGRAKYSGLMGGYVIGTMDEPTLIRVQALINEIRTLIASSTIDSKHKSRLLSRLEGLQSEMHKELSDLDRFWIFMGEAGRVLGKFGEDVKPLTDRITELFNTIAPVAGILNALTVGREPKRLPSHAAATGDRSQWGCGRDAGTSGQAASGT